MKKNKYICPYCGAPAEFCRPFCRPHKFLFWTIWVPRPMCYADCSALCDDYLNAHKHIRGESIVECRRNWLSWYEAETAGLPDIPILAIAKFGKDAK